MERSRLILWHMKAGCWPFCCDYRWAGLSVFAKKRRLPKQAVSDCRGLGLETYSEWAQVVELFCQGHLGQVILFCFVLRNIKMPLSASHIMAEAFVSHQNVIWCNSWELSHSTNKVVLIELWKAFTAFQLNNNIRQLMSLSIVPLLTEMCFFQDWQMQKTKPHPDGERLSAAAVLDFPVVWKLNCSVVVLAGLHREGCTVKTGMLTLSCHCHTVHKVPRRSVTTHSSHFTRACPCHTPGCRSQTAFPSCHLSLALSPHANLNRVTWVQALFRGGFMLRCVKSIPHKQQRPSFSFSCVCFWFTLPNILNVVRKPSSWR